MQKPSTRTVLQPFYLLGLQIVLVFLVLSITRWIFLWNNLEFFEDWKLSEVIWGGGRFDLAAIGMMFLPMAGLLILPLPWSASKWGRWILRVYLWIVSLFVLLGNLGDTAFYRFSLKRSTADILDIMGTGDDFATMLPSYLAENWFLVLLIILLLVGVDRIYLFLSKRGTEGPSNWKVALMRGGVGIAICATLVLMGRGGFGVRAVNIMSAAENTTPERMALVLNTPFCIIKTFGKPALERIEIFEDLESLRAEVDPLHPATGRRKRKNVVVIVLESISHEYSGLLRGNSTTEVPVLDSIMEQSLYFTHCYANAKRSIEGIPAIVSSLPAYMDDPLSSSPYAGTSLQSLPSVLGVSGYSSAFFHGASFGSMAFDQFCASAGFKEYYAREDYPDPSHDDGKWGIYDEYFLPWAVKRIGEQQEPFMDVVFTLNSHHPYTTPEHHKGRFGQEGDILTGVHYVDHCLGLFFQEARKQDWYTNTIFFITADHTPGNTKDYYYLARLGMFHIPLVIFDPTGELPTGPRADICQQLDIMPSVLGITGSEIGYFSLGRDLLDTTSTFYPVATNYLSGVYQIIQDTLLLQHDGHRPLGLYDTRTDKQLKRNILDQTDKGQQLLRHAQAYLQWYNNGMIDNKMTYDALLGDH